MALLFVSLQRNSLIDRLPHTFEMHAWIYVLVKVAQSLARFLQCYVLIVYIYPWICVSGDACVGCMHQSSHPLTILLIYDLFYPYCMCHGVHWKDLKLCSHPLTSLFIYTTYLWVGSCFRVNWKREYAESTSWTALLMQPRVPIQCIDKSTLHVTHMLADVNSVPS
jgi:hypothetical protein